MGGLDMEDARNIRNALAEGGESRKEYERSRPNQGIRGVTLVELLVVLGLIALLASLLGPAVNAARQAAKRSRELAAARHAAQAWVAYAVDQGGHVLPGFKSGLSAYQSDGTVIPPSVYGGATTIAARWPWRLAPYIGGDMRSLYIGEQAERLSALENGDQAQYLYFTSLYPSFGLNSTWVGGDSERLGFLPTTLPNGQRNPLSRFYVTRMGEFRRPSRVALFVASRTAATTDGQMSEGYFRVDSPWLAQQQWGAKYLVDDATSCGNVSARYQDEVVVANADASTEAPGVEALRDMRRWADAATVPDFHLSAP